MNWIPITEKLPTACSDVLVFGRPYGSRSLTPRVFATYISNRPRECVEDLEVTHWMPLPKPPAAADGVTTVPAPYKDSTPELRVGDSSFEGWYSTHPSSRMSGRHTKQDMRDAYAAGMGDPLVMARPDGVKEDAK